MAPAPQSTNLPHLTLVGPDAPQLPFRAAAQAHRSELPSAGSVVLALVGGTLLRGWAHLRTDPSLLLGGREVLQWAAEMTDPTIKEAVALVASHLGQLHDLNEPGIARLFSEIGCLCARVEQLGVSTLREITPEHCLDHIHSAVSTRSGGWRSPANGTLYLRRTSDRLLFRTGRQPPPVRR